MRILAIMISLLLFALPVLAEEVAAPEAAPAMEEPQPDKLLGIRLAPKIGATIPVSDLGVVMFGSLEAGYDLRMLKDALGGLLVPGLSLEFSYLEPGLNAEANDPAVGNYGYTLWQRIMILSFDVTLAAELGALRPYYGIGYGVYFLHANLHSFELTNTEDQIMSGFQTRLGLGYHLGIGEFFGEIRYHDVGLDFLITGDANARGVTTAAGYRFGF